MAENNEFKDDDSTSISVSDQQTVDSSSSDSTQDGQSSLKYSYTEEPVEVRKKESESSDAYRQSSSESTDHYDSVGLPVQEYDSLYLCVSDSQVKNNDDILQNIAEYPEKIVGTLEKNELKEKEAEKASSELKKKDKKKDTSEEKVKNQQEENDITVEKDKIVETSVKKSKLPNKNKSIKQNKKVQDVSEAKSISKSSSTSEADMKQLSFTDIDDSLKVSKEMNESIVLLTNNSDTNKSKKPKTLKNLRKDKKSKNKSLSLSNTNILSDTSNAKDKKQKFTKDAMAKDGKKIQKSKKSFFKMGKVKIFKHNNSKVVCDTIVSKSSSNLAKTIQITKSQENNVSTMQDTMQSITCVTDTDEKIPIHISSVKDSNLNSSKDSKKKLKKSKIDNNNNVVKISKKIPLKEPIKEATTSHVPIIRSKKKPSKSFDNLQNYKDMPAKPMTSGDSASHEVILLKKNNHSSRGEHDNSRYEHSSANIKQGNRSTKTAQQVDSLKMKNSMIIQKKDINGDVSLKLKHETSNRNYPDQDLSADYFNKKHPIKCVDINTERAKTHLQPKNDSEMFNTIHRGDSIRSNRMDKILLFGNSKNSSEHDTRNVYEEQEPLDCLHNLDLDVSNDNSVEYDDSEGTQNIDEGNPETKTEIFYKQTGEEFGKNLPSPVGKVERAINFFNLVKNKHVIKTEIKMINGIFADNYDSKLSYYQGNQKLNRNKDVVPYDFNRVKIRRKILPENASDYICASFISNPSCDSVFIITQSPMDETTASFWSMIFERKSKKIFSFVNFKDLQSGIYKYLPKASGTLEFPLFAVTLLRKQNIDNYKLRICRIVEKSKHSRYFEVEHYHLNTDIENSMRDTRSLDVLIDVALNYYESTECTGPITVHCFYGNQVSPIFIASIMLREHINECRQFSPLIVAMSVRRQFMNTFSSANSYVLLYRLLGNYISRKFNIERSLLSLAK